MEAGFMFKRIEINTNSNILKAMESCDNEKDFKDLQKEFKKSEEKNKAAQIQKLKLLEIESACEKQKNGKQCKHYLNCLIEDITCKYECNNCKIFEAIQKKCKCEHAEIGREW